MYLVHYAPLLVSHVISFLPQNFLLGLFAECVEFASGSISEVWQMVNLLSFILILSILVFNSNGSTTYGCKQLYVCTVHARVWCASV